MHQHLLARLTPTLESKADVIALARARGAAIDAAPVLMGLCTETTEPLFRCICMDALGTILRDSTHPSARACAAAFAEMLEQPRFKRVRRRIIITLWLIGRAGVVALPAIVRVLYSGVRGAVRVPAKGTIYHIAWKAVHEGSNEEALKAIEAVSGMNRTYAVWYLERFLASDELAPALRGPLQEAIAARQK